MQASESIDKLAAGREHADIKATLQKVGINVIQTLPPPDCQDGIYTANWAVVRGDVAVMARLPKGREAEIPYAEKVLKDLGKEIITPPDSVYFSGQGDALACGELLFANHGYRTDLRMHQFLAETLGYKVISLQTIPALDPDGKPRVNPISGMIDSYFYDLDLALAVLSPDLIAWCPQAFTPESQETLRALPMEKIEVSFEEAERHFACNLVSTGETVIMNADASRLKADIEAKGLKTITPPVKELTKGGGFVRCVTLTLDNP
ncbi:MAG TPA: arginine deiminase-related protein [Candidatus Saccharimonadales bacterium]|nr:arginine deiminase-related protein [Candidatus Saccharimonadales bacterium]